MTFARIVSIGALLFVAGCGDGTPTVPAPTSCIDYALYLHAVGSVDTPDWAGRVAVAGDYAYVADSGIL